MPRDLGQSHPAGQIRGGIDIDSDQQIIQRITYSPFQNVVALLKLGMFSEKLSGRRSLVPPITHTKFG